MLYVLEKGERIEGYKAYTAYLTSEYGSAYARNNYHVSIDALAYTPVPTVPVSSESQTSVEKNVPKIPNWMNEEQKDFLQMYANMGMAQTAEMYNLSNKKAWQKYRNLKYRVQYHEKKTMQDS
jgi:hypothetical protein